ncbi:unnamed protein product [Ectocarpus fasciculatus]
MEPVLSSSARCMLLYVANVRYHCSYSDVVCVVSCVCVVGGICLFRMRRGPAHSFISIFDDQVMDLSLSVTSPDCRPLGQPPERNQQTGMTCFCQHFLSFDVGGGCEVCTVERW